MTRYNRELTGEDIDLLREKRIDAGKSGVSIEEVHRKKIRKLEKDKEYDQDKKSRKDK